MKLIFVLDKAYDSEFVEDDDTALTLEKAYERDRDALTYTRNAFQDSWDEINDTFSTYVEQKTERPWKHQIYECVVSPVHPGISNWDGSNRIIRGWKEHPLLMRRITAHELILHHYFVITRKDFPNTDLTDNQIWALAEIAAFALTSLIPEGKTFWPWDTSGYYTDHNYPQIVPLQDALKEPFINRRSFKEYIQTGMDLVRQYPDMNPAG
jgi:hypothetical protein